MLHQENDPKPFSRNTENQKTKYPLLSELSENSGLSILPTYYSRDLAKLFGRDLRTIQQYLHDGILPSRILLGRVCCLPSDLENYLQHSRRTGATGGSPS